MSARSGSPTPSIRPPWTDICFCLTFLLELTVLDNVSPNLILRPPYFAKGYRIENEEISRMTFPAGQEYIYLATVNTPSASPHILLFSFDLISLFAIFFLSSVIQSVFILSRKLGCPRMGNSIHNSKIYPAFSFYPFICLKVFSLSVR